MIMRRRRFRNNISSGAAGGSRVNVDALPSADGVRYDPPLSVVLERVLQEERVKFQTTAGSESDGQESMRD